MDISEQSVREHYGFLLGIEQEWEVNRVEVDRMQQHIEAWVQWRRDEALMCPQCRCVCPGYEPPARAHLAAFGCVWLHHAVDVLNTV